MTNSRPRSTEEVQARRGAIVAARDPRGRDRGRGTIVAICGMPRPFHE